MARLVADLAAAGAGPLACCRPGPVLEACRRAGAETREVNFVPIPPLPPANYAAHAVNRSRTTRVLRDLIRLHRPGIIHANGLISAWYAQEASRKEKIPLVLHLHDILRPGFKLRAILRSLKGATSRVVAVSEAARRAGLDLGLPPDRVVRIYNGLNPEEWSPRRPWTGEEPAQPGPVRLETGTPATAPVLLSMGQLAPWKGARVFLEAASRVISAYPQARFWILGSPYQGGSAYEKLLHRLAENGLPAGAVSFLGWRPQVADVLREADVLVQPSIRPDPLPNAVMEAMATALPVIGSNLGGIPELVVEGETGLLVPPEDSQALGRAMGKLLEDRAAREEMGQAGRRRVESHFTGQAFRQAFINLYQELCPPGPESDEATP